MADLSPPPLGLAAEEAVGALGMMVVGTTTPFPAEVAALWVAMENGFWTGLGLIWTGAMLGAALSYGVGRLVTRRDWLGRFRPVRVAMERLDSLGWRGIAGLRLIPIVPFFTLSLAAGLLRVDPGAYLRGTALGIVPASVIISLLGQGLISENAGLAVAALLAAVASAALVWMVARRRERR